jgi:hypothetical protein
MEIPNTDVLVVQKCIKKDLSRKEVNRYGYRDFQDLCG